MKKIIIAGSANSVEALRFLEEAKKNKFDVTLQETWDQNQQQTDADIIYWRSCSDLVKRFDGLIATNTLLMRMSQNSKVINVSRVQRPHLTIKSIQQALYAANKLPGLKPIPTFLFSSKKEVLEAIKKETLRYPFLIKPNQGAQGIGVQRIKKEADLDTINSYEKNVFQPFIENNGDYRITVIGGCTHDIYLRQNKNKVVNNISAGGTASRIYDRDKYELLQRLGERVSVAFEMQLCGVDILEGVDGSLYFMEININSQWSIESDVSPMANDRPSAADNILNTLQLDIHGSSIESFTDIKKYFEYKLPFLPLEKRFHFLSRMFLFFKEDTYETFLNDIRSTWQTDENTLLSDLQEGLQKNIEDSITSLFPIVMYRAAYIRKFPNIHTYNALFFKLFYNKVIYQEDISSSLIKNIDSKKIKIVFDALLEDSEALMYLSTRALNFLYMANYFFQYLPQKKLLHKIACIPEKVTWHKTDADELHARIFFATHVIINESHFYTKNIIVEKEHLSLLQYAENLIIENYTLIPLNRKCEFLVCAKLCNYKTRLFRAIKQEATASKSKLGMFLSEKGNDYTQSLPGAEHMNVLALMAFLN